MYASQIARSPITNRWGEVPLRPVPHQEFIVYAAAPDMDGDSAYVIHSIEKEDVAVCRFRLRDLS